MHKRAIDKPGLDIIQKFKKNANHTAYEDELTEELKKDLFFNLQIISISYDISSENTSNNHYMERSIKVRWSQIYWTD